MKRIWTHFVYGRFTGNTMDWWMSVGALNLLENLNQREPLSLWQENLAPMYGWGQGSSNCDPATWLVRQNKNNNKKKLWLFFFIFMHIHARKNRCETLQLNSMLVLMGHGLGQQETNTMSSNIGLCLFFCFFFLCGLDMGLNIWSISKWARPDPMYS